MSSAILKELANTPSEQEWKIDYDIKTCGRSIYWHIPETLKFLRSANGYDSIVISRKAEGLEFYVDEKDPNILIYHRPMGGGIRLKLFGWKLAVKGSVTDRMNVVMELIQKLSDIDTMEKLFSWVAEYDEKDLKQDQRKDLLKDL